MTVAFARRSRLQVFSGILLTLASSAAGCSAAPYVWIQDLPPKRQAAPSGRIEVGDVLTVRVYGEEALTTRGTVRPDGTLTIPLVGAVPARGKMPGELADGLKETFKRFVLDPRVIVTVEESLVQVTAVGEVRTPGLLELERPARVLDALARVGGLTEFAKRSRIYVLRPTGAATERIRFDYAKLLEGEHAGTHFELATGDVLVVE